MDPVPVRETMLSKCANPFCLARFQRLGEGKLFLIDTRSHTSRLRGAKVKPEPHRNTKSLHRYWLCQKCTELMDLVLKDGSVQLITRSMDHEELLRSSRARDLPASMGELHKPARDYNQKTVVSVLQNNIADVRIRSEVTKAIESALAQTSRRWTVSLLESQSGMRWHLEIHGAGISCHLYLEAPEETTAKYVEEALHELAADHLTRHGTEANS